MTRNKNQLFGRHFEVVWSRVWYNIKKKILAELWFFMSRTYMVQIPLLNSGGKVVFSGGGFKYLGHLSVKSMVS